VITAAPPQRDAPSAHATSLPATPIRARAVPPPPPYDLTRDDDRPRPPTRPLRGLLVAGSVTFGLAYGFSLGIGAVLLATETGPAQFSGGMLMIPVAGPFVVAARSGSNPLVLSSMIIDGVAQATGLTMVLLGALIQRPDVRHGLTLRAPQWGIAPAAPGAVAGISLAVTHF
jgi:hypothetical protein